MIAKVIFAVVLTWPCLLLLEKLGQSILRRKRREHFERTRERLNF